MNVHSSKMSFEEWKNCSKFFKSTNTSSIKLDNKTVDDLEAYATVGEDVSLLNVFFQSDKIKKVIRIQFDESDIQGNEKKFEVYVLDYLENLGFSMKNLEQDDLSIKSQDFMSTLPFLDHVKKSMFSGVQTQVKLTKEEKAIQKVMLGF